MTWGVYVHLMRSLCVCVTPHVISITSSSHKSQSVGLSFRNKPSHYQTIKLGWLVKTGGGMNTHTHRRWLFMCVVTGVPGHERVYTSMPVCDRLLTLLSINSPGIYCSGFQASEPRVEPGCHPPTCHTHTCWDEWRASHTRSLHEDEEATESPSERKSFFPSPSSSNEATCDSANTQVSAPHPQQLHPTR